MSTFIKSLTVSIATNATLSDACQLGDLGYHRVYVEVPTFSTATGFNVYGSVDGVTYRYLRTASNTATHALNVLTFESGSAGYIAEMPTYAPYMKFQVTCTIEVGSTMKIYGVIER